MARASACSPLTRRLATGIANTGNVPGFISYMQYDPVTEDLFVLLLNDDTRSPNNSAPAYLRSSATPDPLDSRQGTTENVRIQGRHRTRQAIHGWVRIPTLSKQASTASASEGWRLVEALSAGNLMKSTKGELIMILERTSTPDA